MPRQITLTLPSDWPLRHVEWAVEFVAQLHAAIWRQYEEACARELDADRLDYREPWSDEPSAQLPLPFEELGLTIPDHEIPF